MSSVFCPESQTKEYGAVPPVTVMSTTPLFVATQEGLVRMAEIPRVSGWVKNIERVSTHPKLSVMVTL